MALILHTLKAYIMSWLPNNHESKVTLTRTKLGSKCRTIKKSPPCLSCQPSSSDCLKTFITNTATSLNKQIMRAKTLSPFMQNM